MNAYDQLHTDMRRPAAAPPAWMGIVHGMPIVHLYGNPQEGGTQYGTLLQKQLQELHRCLDGLMDTLTKTRMLAYADSQEEFLPEDVRSLAMARCGQVARWGSTEMRTVDHP